MVLKCNIFNNKNRLYHDKNTYNHLADELGCEYHRPHDELAGTNFRARA